MEEINFKQFFGRFLHWSWNATFLYMLLDTFRNEIVIFFLVKRNFKRLSYIGCWAAERGGGECKLVDLASVHLIP